MLTGDNTSTPYTLWVINPSINYRKSSGDCQEILDSIFTGESITPSDCASAYATHIENMQTSTIQQTLFIDTIVHDFIATADKAQITGDGVDVATIDSKLSNAYYAICYLNGVCDDVFSNVGAFEFASLDVGTWRILFIDRTTLETSEISIEAV